ncbi:MAG: V-type ATP synthase subunit F [Zestosphaera sp.]
MSRFPSRKDVVVVGELSFLEGFKLAGVRRLVEVESSENVKQTLAEILAGLYGDPSVGVIVIQQRFRDLIIDKVERVSREQLVVFIPGLKEVPQIDVKDYYSRMVKSYLGVSVEV